MKEPLKKENKACWLWTLEPEESHCYDFPGFSLCLMYPKVCAREVENLETPNRFRLKKSEISLESLLFLS